MCWLKPRSWCLFYTGSANASSQLSQVMELVMNPIMPLQVQWNLRCLRWKMWRKRRCKGTWIVWKRQAFLETFFIHPLTSTFSNIVFSCIRRNWIHWWGPWWTAVGGGESCSSTVTSTGPMQTLGSTSVTCMTSYLFIFSRCFRGEGSNGKDTRFWNTFPHICFIRWNKKYIDSDINVCLLIMVHVD